MSTVEPRALETKLKHGAKQGCDTDTELDLHMQDTRDQGLVSMIAPVELAPALHTRRLWAGSCVSSGHAVLPALPYGHTSSWPSHLHNMPPSLVNARECTVHRASAAITSLAAPLHSCKTCRQASLVAQLHLTNLRMLQSADERRGAAKCSEPHVLHYAVISLAVSGYQPVPAG